MQIFPTQRARSTSCSTPPQTITNLGPPNHYQHMDINSLIDRPNDGGGPAPAPAPAPPSSSSTASSPVMHRRQTVSSLLNDDDHQHHNSHDDSAMSSSPPGTRRPSEVQQETNVAEDKKTQKPKRYETPPIWAREWRGKNNVNLARDLSKLSTTSDSLPAATQNSNSSTTSIQTMQEKQQTSNTAAGLPVSLTGILPHEDLTRKVTEWLFSNMYQLQEDRQYLEVEIKLGSICAKSNERRLDLPMVTESILRSDYARQNTFFQAKMTDEMFNRAMTFLDKLTTTTAPQSANKKTLTKINSRTRDVMFGSRSSPDKLRVTYDEQNQPIEKIVKKRISDLMIYSPGDFLDLRVSLNVELPQSRAEGVSESGHPVMVRNKNRTSYMSQGMQVDMTAVISENASKASKEAEIELDKAMLLEFFDGYSSGSDPKAMLKFEELVRLSIDNARLLNREVSRE